MDDWNYFSYFTEIEEHFWKKRGAHLLVSPLDWAIMETWHQANVPLDAVLKGIDHAFESYQRSRRGAGRPMKTLAYCTDAVLEAAEEIREAAAGATPKNGGATSETFSRDELRSYFARNLESIRNAATAPELPLPLSQRLTEIARSLETHLTLLEAPGALDLEDLERRLTILDEKIQAALIQHASEETMLRIRREVDAQLTAFRRKVKAEQLVMVERQYVQKRVLEEFRLPRLSLFYLS
jgi:hypothetical protein